MQATQELQAPMPPGSAAGLLPQTEHGIDLARLGEVIRQTREMIAYVDNARDGAMLVRRASATDKLLTEALKGCHELESEQFALRQSAAEAHLRTQRRAGELLASMEKNEGGRPSTTSMRTGSSKGRTLAEIGVTRNESYRWQRLATLPAEEFEAYVAECRGRARELTTAGALARARRVSLERRGTLERPSGGEAQHARYQRIKGGWSDLIWLDPAAVRAGIEPAQRPRESEELDRVLAWLGELRTML